MAARLSAAIAHDRKPALNHRNNTARRELPICRRCVVVRVASTLPCEHLAATAVCSRVVVVARAARARSTTNIDLNGTQCRRGDAGVRNNRIIRIKTWRVRGYGLTNAYQHTHTHAHSSAYVHTRRAPSVYVYVYAYATKNLGQRARPQLRTARRSKITRATHTRLVCANSILIAFALGAMPPGRAVLPPTPRRQRSFTRDTRASIDTRLRFVISAICVRFWWCGFKDAGGRPKKKTKMCAHKRYCHRRPDGEPHAQHRRSAQIIDLRRTASTHTPQMDFACIMQMPHSSRVRAMQGYTFCSVLFPLPFSVWFAHPREDCGLLCPLFGLHCFFRCVVLQSRSRDSFSHTHAHAPSDERARRRESVHASVL